MSVCVFIAFAFVRQFALWVQDAPPTPDPWGPEAQSAIDSAEAVQVCHHCSTPQEEGAWFCPHCGCAVGAYNNLLLYVQCLSDGEVLRNGVNDRFRMRPLILIGYLLVSLEGYLIFAPFYWFFLLRNLLRRRDDPLQSADAPSG